jgi:GTP-binding protein EngB required for normal cell division
MENVEYNATDVEQNATEEEAIKRELQAHEAMTIAVVGRGGAGKSSTVNSLVGKPVAPVSHSPREGTVELAEYFGETNGFQFRIFDTRGFGNSQVPSAAILKELATRIDGRLHILLYVVPLTLDRLDRIDKSAIHLLHEHFSRELWDHVVVVFTRADLYGPKFVERVDVWTKALSAEIAEVVDQQSAEKVGFVAISNSHLTNPDGKEWMAELFTQVLERIGSPPSFVPLRFLWSQSARIHTKRARPSESTAKQAPAEGPQSTPPTPAPPPINLDESQRARVFRRIMVATGPMAVGAGVGGTVGGPAGAIIGAGLGLIVGIILGESV